MKAGNINLDITTGHFRRKLEVIARHASALAKELGEIEDNYCPECGSELKEIKSDDEVVWTKYCAKCKEHYRT